MYWDDNIDKWFALFVMTGKEEKVKMALEQRFEDELRFLVPKRKLRERKGGVWEENTRVLFPGYVLINGEVTEETYHKFRHIPGLIKLLKSGNDILNIEFNEMEILSKLICNGETISYSEILMENDRIRVLDGPLALLEGCIVSINKRKGRVKVQLSFMGELRTIDLGITVLEKV